MTPEQYADAHANLTIQGLQKTGVQPNFGDYSDAYNTALKSSLEYQKGIASKIADTKIDLEKKIAETPIDLAKAKQEELNKDSISKDTQDKVAGFADSWSTVNQIDKGWDEAAKGFGFSLKIGGQMPIPFVGEAQTAIGGALDANQRAYYATVKSSMTSLAKGVMGDNAQQAGEPRVQGALLQALPDAGDSANSKAMKMDVWRQKIYTNALNFVQAKSAAGVDISPYAKQLAPILQWGQVKSQQQQLVSPGLSDVATKLLNVGAAQPTNDPKATPNATPSNTPAPTSTPTGSTGTKVATGADTAPDFFKNLLGLK
jgi:hypothetical protein